MPYRTAYAQGRFRDLLALTATALLAAGCSEQSGPATATAAAPATAPAPAAAATSDRPLRETWDIMTIQGSRVGYGQTRVSRTTRDGRELMRIESVQHLDILRFGQRAQQEISFSSLETPDGKLLEFESTVKQGAAPIKTTGRVAGKRLEMETVAAGAPRQKSIAWSDDYGGFYAMESSLAAKPLQPGQRRNLKSLMIAIDEVVTTELTARDFESVKLRGGSYDLLRVDAVTKFADGQTLDATLWCDRTGDILKQQVSALKLETYRATKEEALEQTQPGSFDLGTDIAVKVTRPIPDAQRTTCVRYRLSLPDRDPAAVFVSGPAQRVKSLGPTSAEVTVYAIRPGHKDGNPDAAQDPPTADDRLPNAMIQSDDAMVKQRLREAVTEPEQDPWRLVCKLEAYVNRIIVKKDFSKAFATAAEVAKDPAGDCSEHAVLLAALARASGLPARVAMGLVYVARDQAFEYHMWTQVYIDGRWIPIDGTLGQGGIGAAHLELAHSNLQGGSAYTSMLPVFRIAGKLKIEVLDAK